MPKIHSTALVDSSARIAGNVEIGPYCVVGPDVEIGDGCKLLAQCHIGARVSMGSNNTVYPFAAIGTDPQDYAYAGALSHVKIGSGNKIREGVTINPGTKEGTATVVGDNCLLMANSHVAHNCRVGNRVILANGALLAGYVEIGDNAILSGNTAVHQFCRVGRLAMLSGVSAISMDLPPFMITIGRTNNVAGLNLVGMKRSRFSKDAVEAIKDVYRIFFKSNLNGAQAIEKIEKEIPQLPEVKEFLGFVKSTKRGVMNREGHKERG